jgi:hypothetical protein
MADAESNNNDDLDPKPAAGNRMGWVEVGGWPEAVLDVPPTSNGTKDNPQWLLVGNVPTREEYAAALGTESYSWAAKTVRAPATADVPEHYEQYLQWVPPHVSVPDGYQGYYARSFPVDGFYAAQEQEIAPQSPEPPHLEGWAGQRSVATVSPLLDDRLITQGWMQDDGRFHYTEDLPAQLSIRDNEDVELTGLANSSLILRIGEPPEIGQRGSWLVGKRLDSPNVSFYRVYATFIPEERLTSDYVQEQARQAAFTVAEVVPIGFLPPSSTFPRPETTWAAVPAIPVEQIGAQIPAPQPVELPVVGQRVVAPEPARADDDGPLLDGPVSLAWQRDGTSFYPVSDPAVIGTGNDIGNGGVEDIGLNRSSLVLNVGETPAVGTPGVWLLGKRLEGPDANDERVVARFIPG